MDASIIQDRFEFAGFCFARHSGGLFRQDAVGGVEKVPLGSRALDVLGVLLSHPGELLSKQAIMQAVWPGMIVDEKNLTVQIATLRRVLDEGRTDRSCIQTEAGRGYRFVAPVVRRAPDELPPASPSPPAVPDATPPPAVAASPSAASQSRPRRVTAAVAASALLIGALVALAWFGGWFGAGTASPRLSIVVLPFRDMDDDPTNDYLADAITEDLTTDLSRIAGTWIIARETAYTYKGKAVDVRQIGRELGVRYVLEGSVRQIGAILQVNVQLISAETGAHLWSDRFDEAISQLAFGQQQIIARLYDTIGLSLVEIESARSQRERPANPDAFDLILRARALNQLPPTPQRAKEMLALYERALLLDPRSAHAMAMVAYLLTDTVDSWGSSEDMRRAGRLLEQARALEPRSPLVLNNALLWLRTVGRCAEVIEAAEHAIQIDPNRMRTYTGVYNELAVCKARVGRAEEELALQAQVDQLNPRSPFKFNRYRRMGFAALMLGRDQDAIAFLQRSMALHPENPGRHWVYRNLAAAFARTGQMEEAKRALSEGDRLWPYFTIRGVYPEELSSPVYVQQIRNYQAALQLAGARDHADEDADFGVPADGALRGEAAGRTPTEAPGARTIRTPELVQLLDEMRPLVIDTALNSWGRSIPGAVGLRFSGLGGSFADEAQDRLRRKMAQLTSGNLSQPVVAVGWNSERFDGRNLALRLTALGYTRVYWYRGGREAWEVAELPEAALTLHEW